MFHAHGRLALAGILLALSLGVHRPAAAETKWSRTDADGSPLPAGARARLGTTRWRVSHPVSMALSHDGKVIAVSNLQDGLITLRDTMTWKELRLLVVGTAGGRHLAFSQDGKRLASAGERGRIHVFDVASGALVRPLGDDDDGRTPVVAFSADGKRPAARYDESEGKVPVRIWEVATGKKVNSLSIPDRQAMILLSPDGQRLASLKPRVSAPWDSIIQFWDVDTGRALRQLKPGGSRVHAAVFSPDGRLLATADLGSQGIHLWETTKGSEVRTLNDPKGQSVTYLEFSPDGRTLAVADNDARGRTSQVVLWELVSGKVRAEFTGHAGAVLALAFSPDGRTLASGGRDTTIFLWDVTRPAEDMPLGGKLSPEELRALWADLESTDAGKGYRAIARLVHAPTRALALLRKEVKPVPGRPLTGKEIDQAIADLDSDTFATRVKARQTLEQEGRTLDPRIHQALAAKPSLEKRRQLEYLLQRIPMLARSPRLIRPVRAVEVLERIGTDEARALLEKLAKGNRNARLTADARAALLRLRRKP